MSGKPTMKKTSVTPYALPTPNNDQNDENLRLINPDSTVHQQQQHYGTLPEAAFSSSTSLIYDGSAFSGESSEEMISSNKIAKRKKKRLQKHHNKPAKPKLVSKLSYIVGSARQSEDETDQDDDIIDMPPENLIIPELDPNADEVKKYVPATNEAWLRNHKVNLSNIRENYHRERLLER
ncbi:hypothetical protein BDF20DRAFT_431175 [Mycotypha africana]|uniref:uncharacterized protein n=1 Tax=Mycotypha africana TaxID=64632 RepID=UPI002301DD65|nr:uncharacterized protein BDF20DRAFT_431175 [Mycotypha africana]KAI8981828.1 hypothetical protein BDF20DRAFT_431175 [Mycotypha africana]